LKYNNDGKINWLISWIFLAACFHVSSLIVFPAIALASFRNVTTFTLLTLVSIVGFIGFFFTGAAIVTALANANLAFTKIAYYLQQNPISLSFGWLNILDLIFVLLYFIYRASIDRVASVRLLTRLIFVGATIHLFSGSITFLARVCFFFYFIAIYVFCVVPKGESTRLFSIRSYNTLILALFFSGMLTLNFISYFRNEQAPVQFSNMTFRLLSFFEDDYVRKLANDKYYDATQDMNNIL
ncbi:EpsG family protein, partial [Cronobacter sakazakii]|nr:EpsG family protein [Cronobacter sakazakii]